MKAAMSNEKVNFGVIGYGAWGSCHANAISKTQDANHHADLQGLIQKLFSEDQAAMMTINIS